MILAIPGKQYSHGQVECMIDMTSHLPVVILAGGAHTVRTLRVTGRGGGGIPGNASLTTTNPTERAVTSARPPRRRAGGRSPMPTNLTARAAPLQEGQPYRSRSFKPTINRHALPAATLTNLLPPPPIRRHLYTFFFSNSSLSE